MGVKREWHASRMPILDGRYTISVGAVHYAEPDDGKPDYYSIDIEKPFDGGDWVVSALNFDLDFVAADKIYASATDIATFDPESRIITYDLGKSVFKYVLKADK